MSYIDKDLLFADALAITATAVGTNVIDLSQARSIGSGEPMAVVFQVDVAALTSDTDEDYTFDVEVATNAAQTTGRQLLGRRVFESGTPTAPAQAASLLAVGFQFVIVLPPISQAEDERYLGIRATLAGTTAGLTYTAWLTPMALLDNAKANYASGYTF